MIRRLALMLAAGLLLFGQLPGAPIVLQAEQAPEIINPDAANDIRNSSPIGQPEAPPFTWMVVPDSEAFGGFVLLAPPSPHKQTSNPSLQEGLARFDVTPDTAGDWFVYLRGRNGGGPGDGSTDSVWLPLDWNDTTPSDLQNLPQSNEYEWVLGEERLSVLQENVAQTHTFYVGVRENSARVDAIVLSPIALDDSELDGLFESTPPPTPTPTPTPEEAACDVSTVAELDAALASALPGTEIVLCNGEWRDVDLRFYGERSANGMGGTQEEPIVLRAATPGGVRLTGSSRLRIEGPNMHVDGLFFDGAVSTGHGLIEFRKDSDELAHDCVVRNVAMIGCNPADNNLDYKWLSVYGTGNRVENCTFGERTHRGVTLTVWLDESQPPSAAVIEGCHFYGRALGSGNGFETIRIGTSERSELDANVIVRANLFAECDGEIELISSKSVGNQFLHNTFRRNRGQLTLRHGSDCLVDGNFFFGDGASDSSGVRIVGPRHVITNNYFEGLEGTGTRAAIALMNGVPNSPLNRYLPIEDVTIAFNTIVNCAEPFSIGNTASEGDTTVAPADSLVANNVVLGSSGNLIRIINAPVNFTWAGNIMSGAPIGYPPALTGTKLVNPQLTISAGGLYRPQIGSPLINAADPLLSTTHDMDGQARPAGSDPDVGADELSSEPETRGPLLPEQVGALWLRPISSIESLWVH